MSKFLFRKGHVVSKDTSKKISSALMGRKLSAQHVKAVSDGHKRFFMTKEGIELRKIKSEQMKGHIPWNKGRKKCYSREILERMSNSHKGKKHSKETVYKRMLALPRGDKHHWWKNGAMEKYPENEKIRKSLEYKLWRKACFERDNFTCQKTGNRGGKLVVHHVNNFNDFNGLRLAIDNGITLSKESHIMFHKIYGKKNNTREQLEEFLNN